jgi:3-oxoacyl-[acyl-carrier protein] reductase
VKKRFLNKVALVVGAGSGIGKSVAINFAKEGARLVLVNLFKEELDEVCKLVKKMGNKCIAIQGDTTKEKEVIDFTQAAIKKFGMIDILVYSAGTTIECSIVDMDSSKWDEVHNVNLKAVFLCTREALKVMTKNNYGKIINIGSICSRKAFARGAAYCSSKFGLLGLTEAAAAEVKKYNININAVLPARTNTRMYRKYHPSYKNVKDLMEPEDIAKVVLFLASEDARAVKGSWIEVTNGQTLYEWDGQYYDYKKLEENLAKKGLVK